MGGLARICKLYGSMKVTGTDGKTVTWVWDYAQDKARLKTEMTKEEFMASEKAKWMGVKKRNGEKSMITEADVLDHVAPLEYNYEGQQIHDAMGDLVAEIRMWGSLGHLNNAEELQDKLGEMIVTAFNEKYYPEKKTA